MRVKHRKGVGSLRVEADQDGLVSRSGTVLVAELARRLGLIDGLSEALAGMHSRAPLHAPGQIVCDLATMLVDGGDCVLDLGALAEQPDLFGEVASHSTASRLLYGLAEGEREALRAARAQARERAWAAGARPAEIVLDFDAHLLECHSEKEGAAPHRKGGFGFHPLCCWLDETEEALAGILRPGNAGANDADDHVAVLDQALAQLPDRAREDWSILARADTAGATHKFAAALRERKVRFSLGYPVQEHVGEAAVALPKRRWKPALDRDGEPRDGAWVAELTDVVDLCGWPQGTRLICRKERPHPGAQLRFTDSTATATNASSPTSGHARWPSSSCATASTPASRTASRRPPSSASGGFPSRSSSPTRPGSSSCCWPRTCSPGCARSCSTANSRSPSPSACASASCTSPGASPAPPAGAPSTCPAPGPGPPS